MADSTEVITPSMENIQYQDGSILLPTIAEWFIEIRKRGNTIKDGVYDDKVFLKKLKDITGLSIIIVISSDIRYGISSIFSSYHDVDTILKPLKHKTTAQGLDILKKKKVDSLNVFIDYKKGTVSGELADIPSVLIVNRALLSNLYLDAMESAGIFIHELGHAWNNLAYLGTVYRDNMIIAEAIDKMRDTTLDKKITIMADVQKKLDIRLPKINELITDVNDNEQVPIQLALLSETRQRTIDLTGYDFYNDRTCEQLADLFAVQHKAARYVAAALDKLDMHFTTDYKRSKGKHVLIETAKAIAFMNPLLLPLGIYVLCSDKEPQIYDKPIQRLQTMQQILRASLKDRSLDPSSARAQEIISDLNFIDGIIGDAKDRMTFADFMYSKLFPSGRKRLNNEETQKAIESLVSSKLYVSAMLFKQLGVKK